MTVLAILAIVEAVALVAVVLILTRYHGAQVLELHAREVADRRELLNRIQRPDHIPVQVPEHYPVPDEPVDEIDLVGTIHTPEV